MMVMILWINPHLANSIVFQLQVCKSNSNPSIAPRVPTIYQDPGLNHGLSYPSITLFIPKQGTNQNLTIVHPPATKMG